MLNLLRKFLRPTLREQLEAGVREALRRYADRHTAPNLRVFVSTDLIPQGVDPDLWARDEADHLRRFSIQWAEDNNISRAGLHLEVVLLDTKREFAFVKPIGLEPRHGAKDAPIAQRSAPRETTGTAVLDVVSAPALSGSVRVDGELTLGRKADGNVQGAGDRYMSARHARLHVDHGRLWVTDLDSKNRSYLNDQPLPPHQPQAAAVGDTLRMGTTILRVAQVKG